MSKSGGLTVSEKATYSECNEVIREHLGKFVQVGLALKKIHDKHLYRDEFGYGDGGWRKYLRVYWEMANTRSYQLMDAVKFVEQLKLSTMVDKLPEKERHVRPIVQHVPDEDSVKVWGDVLALADKENDGRVTAKIVNQVVEPYKTNGEATEWDSGLASDRLVDWLRAELKKWPDDDLPEAVHWVEQIAKEFRS